MAAEAQLTRLIAWVRANTDESDVRAKYSDSDLIDRLEGSFAEVLTELGGAQDDPLLVRHNISISEGSTVFLLPPCVGELLRIAKRSGTTEDYIEWQLLPRPMTRFQGKGLYLEGRMLRFEPPWAGTDYTLELLYIPTGDFRFHYGTSTTFTTNTITLAASPTLGTLDTRDNAYTGAILRVLGNNGDSVIQERFISSYDRSTRIATVEPAFSPALDTTCVYEVIPSYFRQLERLAAWNVALDLLSIRGNAKKYGLMASRFQAKMRTTRIAIRRRESMLGTHFTQTPGDSLCPRIGNL